MKKCLDCDNETYSTKAIRCKDCAALAKHNRTLQSNIDKLWDRRYASLAERHKATGCELPLIIRRKLRLLLDKPCSYCKQESSSVIRIDESIGFVEDNCKPICTTCLRCRWDMNEDEFLMWIRLVEANNKPKTVSKPSPSLPGSDWAKRKI